MTELTDLMYEFCMRGGTIEMGQNLDTGAFECWMKAKIEGKEHGVLVRHPERDRSVFSKQMRYSLEQFDLEWTRQRIKEGAEVVETWPEWKKNCLHGANKANKPTCNGCKGTGSVQLGESGEGSFMVTCRHCCGSGKTEVKND